MKNKGLQTRQQELEYVKKFTSRFSPDGEINHAKFESLARDLNFMRTIINIMDCKIAGSPDNYDDYECFNGLRSSIETMYECEHIKNDFFNAMMNELYNITLLTMNDEQYQEASKLAEIIKY
jgi:hypothetical protein